MKVRRCVARDPVHTVRVETETVRRASPDIGVRMPRARLWWNCVPVCFQLFALCAYIPVDIGHNSPVAMCTCRFSWIRSRKHRVELLQWGGEGTLHGRVYRVEPTGDTEVSAFGVEGQRGDVVVRLDGANAAPTELGTGYRVVARFMLWEGADVLQVPQSALFRHGGEWAVFAVSNGRASLQPVEVGHRSGLHAQITRGLSEGDRVVTHPERELADGDRVQAR